MTRWECDKRRQVHTSSVFFSASNTPKQQIWLVGYHHDINDTVSRCSPTYGGKGFPIFLALKPSILKDFTAEVQRVRGDQARLSVRGEAPKVSRQFSFWICWIDENGDIRQVPGEYEIVELLNQRKREDLSTEHHLISRHRTTKVGIWIRQAKVAVFIPNIYIYGISMDQMGMTIEVRAPIWVHGHRTRYLQMLCSLPFFWDEQRKLGPHTPAISLLFSHLSQLCRMTVLDMRKRPVSSCERKLASMALQNQLSLLQQTSDLNERVMHSAQLMRQVPQLSP